LESLEVLVCLFVSLIVGIKPEKRARKFGHDTELALGMTLLELHYILQVFCVHQEDRGGVNWGI